MFSLLKLTCDVSISCLALNLNLRLYSLVPVSQVLKYLEQEDLQLTHYGLGPRGVMALAEVRQCSLSLSSPRGKRLDLSA